MSIYNPDDYKDIVLRVNYKYWKEGTECLMSGKGNIITKLTGELVFTKNTIEHNPDLMGLFFASRLLTILSRAEVKLIRDLLKIIDFNPSDVIYIKEEKPAFLPEQRFLTIKSSTGWVLIQVNITKTEKLFRTFKANKYCFTVKEFENATIGL